MYLTQYQGLHRLLLVFAPSTSDERHAKQERLFSGEETGFKDRELLLMRLLEDGEGDAAGCPATPEAAASVRREYGVEDGRFAIALVGKDGGIKLRADAPVAATEIFNRIDAMPMRRREMRERDGGSR